MSMKRASALVSYSSSEDDETPPAKPSPPVKRRKLPPLSSSLAPKAPVDRPELHQGRVRSTPHVEGQWAAHVYVSVFVEKQSALFKLLDKVLEDARSALPALHSSWEGKESSDGRELHISLSRPIFLRTHQREDLKRAVKALAKAHSMFQASFVSFSELTNDERTRTFLAIEVGAGHRELEKISDDLTPTLHSILQREFYQNPRFHASIAWALLERPNVDESSVTSEPGMVQDFPTISCLPKDLIESLNDHHASRLSSPKVGTFTARGITARIGKECFSWCFSEPNQTSPSS